MSDAAAEDSPTRPYREALRARLVAAIPRGYSPLRHLAVPSLAGLAASLAAAAAIRGLRPLELLTVPVVFLFANMTEWRAHRDLLHRRIFPFHVLYDRHTPEHHMVFVTEDMSVRDRREWRLVLLPWFGIVAILAATAPITATLALLGLRNEAALFVITSMAYVVSYEWLHLAYHLPPESAVGRFALVRVLRRHHATHHAPSLMRRWNFNVTIPLWDWIRGTIYRGLPPAPMD